MYLMFRKYSVEEEEMLRIIFNDVDKAHYKVDPSNILYKVITKKKNKSEHFTCTTRQWFGVPSHAIAI